MAALSIAGPPAIFTGMLMAEPFGYTLSLCVVLVGLRGGRDRRHAVVAGPTAFSRRRRRRRARRARLCVGAGLRLRPLEADVFVILLAAVAAIAPSAVVGVAQAIARPRSRVEAAFGWIVVSLTALLVTQCVLWGDVHRVQERYLGYALPLLAVAFAVRSSRPGRRPVQEIGVAAGIAVVAALVPLSGYAIYAFIRLERALGGHASTAGVFATPRRCLRPSAASAARCSCCSREVDWLEDPFVHVAPDGTVGGLHGDVVVDVSPATAVTLRDPRRVRAFGAVTLWRPVDRVRLAAIMNNRLSDGLVLRSGGARSTRPRAHGHRRGPWTGGFVASPVRVRGRQWRSPIVSVPRYVPDPAACSQIH